MKGVANQRTVLRSRVREAFASVLPVTLVLVALSLTVAPLGSGVMLSFLFGAALLVVGMGMFTLGADLAMMPMGEAVSMNMTRSRKLWLIILVSFVVGAMITASEPDLTVLAEQVPSIPNLTLVLTVSLGVGAFLVIAVLRILLKVPLKWLLLGFYALVFALAFFIPESFQAVAFDAGGVTTGPMTVPFIMAFGLGVSAIRSDKNAAKDSFGLVALCSVGPILAVMVLALVFDVSGGAYSTVYLTSDVVDTRELLLHFANALPGYAGEVGIALLPIVGFFAVYQIAAIRLPKSAILRIATGIVFTYVGLVLFLTGVNAGFLPAGMQLGRELASAWYRWLLIPVGMIVGFFIVAAEPAVYVLNKQVEDLTSGAIPQKAMLRALSLGVMTSVGLAMLRVLTGISILWFLVPGYVAAFALSFFVPDMFTAIAFDSGGVASGPMTAAFLLPFAMGACEALGGASLYDAFGVVAMVAMTPLIAIQLLGVLYKRRIADAKAALALPQEVGAKSVDSEIIDV